jgi:chaperone required for assembly of F1-ATPase
VLTRAKPDPLSQPKRFYKAVTTAPAEGGGFAVLLDGRQPRTPNGAKLVLPTEALAELIAEEWTAQGDVIAFAHMPATRLAFTAIDRIGAARAAVAEETARYAAADLLCYFAEGPASLVREQEARWGPLLDWAKADLGLHFVRTTGIVHTPQPDGAVQAVKALAEALDVFALAGLAHAAGLYGSAVLALAAQRGRLSAPEAFELSRLDEAFQEARWGVDAEAAQRTATLAAEAAMLERWFGSLS